MTTPTDSVSPKSYLDFTGLGELKAQAQKDQNKAIKQAAQQFEGLFIQMMIKSMRDASPKDDHNQSSAVDTFQGMFDQEVSTQMAKRSSFGVANFLTQALQKRAGSMSTADIMKARESMTNGYSLQPQEQPSLSLDKVQLPIDLPHHHDFKLNGSKRYGRSGGGL
jgi:Rod binding domain-containing protein